MEQLSWRVGWVNNPKNLVKIPVTSYFTSKFRTIQSS